MRIITVGSEEIHIANNVLQIFCDYKQDSYKKHESGGILIGQIVNDNLEIHKVSIPNKFDKSSRRSFERDKDAAQVIIDFEFCNSNGTYIYLGEWHTHYENKPIPSSKDIKMIKQQHKINTLNSDKILLIIVGLEQLFVGVYNGKTLESDYVLFQ